MFLFRERESGGRDGFASGFLGGAGLVEVEEEGEDVGIGGHAVGGADGGIEFGLGIAQGICAGVVEGAVEITQRPIHFGHHVAAELTEGNGGSGDSFDLFASRGLWPWEGVEHGAGGVVEIPFKF